MATMAAPIESNGAVGSEELRGNVILCGLGMDGGLAVTVINVAAFQSNRQGRTADVL